MSAYFDELERELRAAVPRVVTSDRRVRPWRRRRPARRLIRRPGLVLGELGAAVGAAVAVAVVALALILPGHGLRPRGQGHPTALTATEGALGLGQLEANFAVLRRPQTSGDRSWRPACPCGGSELPALTRLATRLDNGDRVFLTVERLDHADFGLAAGSYALHVDVVSPDGRPVRGPGGVTNGSVFAPATNFTVFPFATPRDPRARRLDPIWIGIVPDGVGSVGWTFACPRQQPADRCGSHPDVTSVGAPHGNVAAALVPGTGECDSRRWTCSPPARTVWTAGSPRLFTVHHLVSFDRLTSRVVTPPFVPTPLLQLRGDGLAGLRFGSSPQTALAALRPRLGSPSSGGRPATGCGVDDTLIWPVVVDPSTGRFLRARGLLLAFSHHRLVGYQFGGVPTVNPSGQPRVAAATARGMRLGDRLARGRRLYGRAFTISSAQGGSWSAQTATGRIIGYAKRPVPRGDLSAQGRVGSIGAGLIGCPAVSP